MKALDRFAEETRKRVIAAINCRTEEIARRDNLDLKQPSRSCEVHTQEFCTEDRGLYNLYRRVFSVPVREVSLIE